MDTRAWVFPVDDGVYSADKNFRWFVVARHDYSYFWCVIPEVGQSAFDATVTADVVHHHLVETENPRNRKEDREATKCKPLQNIYHRLGELFGNTEREGKGDNDYRKEDETSIFLLPR